MCPPTALFSIPSCARTVKYQVSFLETQTSTVLKSSSAVFRHQSSFKDKDLGGFSSRFKSLSFPSVFKG